MTVSVTVIDYGIGNLYSVSRALEHVGGDVVLSADPSVIENSERLILPGVGAFEDGMGGLRDRGLIEPIKRFAAKGSPLLGVCLGMQMFATASEEFGEHKGLGLIAGKVVPVPRTTAAGERHKIPHIAWGALSPSAGAEWKDTFLEDTSPGTAAYLVHSFHLIPDDPAHLLADCVYGNHRLTAAVRAGKVFGAQFHPEKSGAAGLQMLAAFLRL